jgi:hypothetical protein
VPRAAYAGVNPDLTDIFISKIDEEGTFSFEGCVVGSNILAGGTIDFPGNTQGALPLTLAEGEWCYEQNAPDESTLDSLFPSNGVVYTFAVPSAAGTFNYTVDYNVTKPPSAPVISSPTPSSNVLSDRDLTAAWTLSGVCTGCDGILFEFDSGLGNTSATLGIAARSSVVASSNVEDGPGNEIFVSTFDGVIDSTPPAQNGDDFLLGAVYEVAALSQFSGVARTMDISEVLLFKGVDRADGVVIPVDPYFFESCVVVPGMTGGSIQTPDGVKAMIDEGGNEWCFDQGFADRTSLDATYPSAGETYTFVLAQADGAIAQVAAVFDEVEPGASTVVTNPLEGAEVPPAMDLNVTWTLDLGAPACTVGVDCGDGISVFVEDDVTFMEVFAADPLAITATNVVVPAASLTGGPDFLLETQTFNGVDMAGLLDGETDTYDSRIRYEDLNETVFSVPEPTALAVQVAALMTLGALARRRRRA